MENIKILGNLYTLKPLFSSDISEKYIGWLNDKEVNSFLEIRNTTQTHQSVKEYIDSFYCGSEKYLWGIYTKQNKHIGTVNITSNDSVNAELGLMIGDKDYWGKQASDEAISLVLDFAFNTLNIKKISGGCYAKNIGMVFTYKKLGFSLDKVLKINLDEKHSEVYRWSILLKDWRGFK